MKLQKLKAIADRRYIAYEKAVTRYYEEAMQPQNRKCSECGTIFFARRGAGTCSDACRQRRSRRKRAANGN